MLGSGYLKGYRMNNVETFANTHADDLLEPLQVSTAVGPVLATPAYGAYVTGIAVTFGLGVLSDICCQHDEDEATGPAPQGASAGQLLDQRVTNLK